MSKAVVVHLTLEKYQDSWGSLWNACEAYFDGRMQPAQRAGFELVVPPAFLQVVHTAMMFAQLGDRLEQLEPRN